VVRDAPELVGQRQIFVEGLGVMIAAIREDRWSVVASTAIELHAQLDSSYSDFRHEVMKHIARGQLDMHAANRLLESIRWLRRVSRHLEQIAKHYLHAIGAVHATV
jgi:phosphate:Na+ symporter